MNIIVAVTGSIACYKAFDLVRGLTKRKHHVRVVLTQGALDFIKPEIFKHLGADYVYLPQDDHNPTKEMFDGLEHDQVLHIALARWAQKVVVAPLSANSLNKLGHGLADDLLSCLFLALKPEVSVLLFPAMNPAMWDNAIVKKNRETLSSLPLTYMHSTMSGEMVCGENGDGKLASVDEMLTLIQSFEHKALQKKVLITTGATIAPIDPVRFVTNASSGETGYWLAVEALRLGYQVHLVATKYSTPKIDLLIDHPRVLIDRVSTTQEMFETVTASFKDASAYISSAAIGDIAFHTSPSKLKKDQLSGSLPFEKSQDILKHLLSLRSSEQTMIGFAAETDLSLTTLDKKWNDKPVDLLIGTKVGFNQGFGDTAPEYLFYRGNQNIVFQGTLTKEQLAHKILESIRHDQTHSLHV